jgi:hypothetical protein
MPETKGNPCIYNYVQFGFYPQSTELTRGPPELVRQFCLQGEFTSAQERCMS